MCLKGCANESKTPEANLIYLISEHDIWSWVDQTPFDYNNWQEGEPNNLDDNRYCSKVYATGVGEEMLGKWDDTLCEYPLAFICEIKRGEKVFKFKQPKSNGISPKNGS